MARMRLKKTSAKGHKWKKGQSCVSNPEITKHRQAARGCFFQRLEGNSNLTLAALDEHNKALKNSTARIGKVTDMEDDDVEEEEEDEGEDGRELTEMEKQMQELDVEEDDLVSGGGRTFNTFATSFSTCTLPAFEKFFRTFDTASEQHTRMLGIHTATQEYLRETKTPETSTSYFCGLMVTLEGVRDSEEDTAAALALLSRVARRVAKEVLRAKFGVFAATLSATLDRYGDSGNSSLVANAIGSLSVLLRGQGRGEWSNQSTLAMFNTIMAYTVHPKPKIRKAAQYNTSAILSASSFLTPETSDESTTATNATRHPAAAAAAEFCLVNLRLSTESGNAKTTLHTLVLLRQIIASLPRKQLKAVCECLLSIMQIGQALINTSALQAFHALFSAHPPPEVLPASTNAALIHALTQGTTGGTGVAVPGKNDPQPACAWITVITVAIINLFRLSEEEGMNHLQKWCQVIVPYWQSDHHSVQTKVRESLEVLLKDSVEVSSAAVRGGAGAGAVFGTLMEGLSLQYQPAWGHVFMCMEAAFPALGPAQPATAHQCLATLCQLMANPRLPHRPSVERAVGAAVAALGPRALLAVVSPKATGEPAQDEDTWWVLPLLRKYVRGCGLGVFVADLVPLASQCFTLLARLEKEGQRDGLLGRAYQQVEQQVWAALPSFCRAAGDVDEALAQESFARLLCDHIKHRPDTRPAIMEALRVLLTEHQDSPGRLATYAKNYLPALFNVYLTAPGTAGVTAGQRQAALATVRAFVAVVPQERAQELLAMVLERHGQAQSQGKGQDGVLRRRALLDLAGALVPRLAGPALARLYDHVAPLLASKEHGQQKASYRLLEEMLAGHTPASAQLVEQRLDQLREALVGQLASVAPSARAPRLRCLRLLLLGLGPGLEEAQWRAVVQQVVGEAVVCCGRAMSQATRRAAFLLVSEVGAVIQRLEGCSPQDTVCKALELLLAGLAGSPSLASATMLALTALTYQYRQHVTSQVLDVLVQNTCVQLLCPSREIVASCLSFIKAITTVFTPQRMAPHLQPIMQAMAAMTPDCQRKYRLKTRDILDRLIRRFGADAVAALVPPGETILHKRIRNLRKLANRKQREREERRKRTGEEEEEEDDGMMARALPASLDEILAEIASDSEDDDKKGKGKKTMGNKKKKKKGNTWIKEDNEEIVDLLDASAGQAIVSGQAAAAAAARRGAGGTGGGAGRGFEVDKESGKLIIVENGKKEADGGEKMDFTDDLDDLLGLKAAAAGGKVKKRKRADSVGSAGDGGGGGDKGQSEEVKKKKKKKDPGAEFRSGKAGGDMTRRGDNTAPYAYVRLSKEQLNRRKKAKFEGQFGSLVRGARKGVAGARKKGRKK